MSKEERFNLLYQKIIEKYNYIDDNRKIAKEDLNNDHKDTIIWIIILFIVFFMVVGGIFFCGLFLSDTVYNKISSAIPIVAISSIIILRKIFFSNSKNRGFAIKTYYKDYKEKVINELVKSFNNNIEYHFNSGLDMPIYERGEFEYFDKYSSDDLIYGTLENGTNFFIADVNTFRKHKDSKGNVYYTSLFKGLSAECEIENKTNSTIYIKKDIVSLRKNNINIKQVELDSQEFENIFNVFSDNQIVTMQILTADIMNMLIDFYREIPFEITIKNTNIYIRFFTGKMFENPKLNKEALDRNTLYEYYCILDFTFELINKLQETINKVKI